MAIISISSVSFCKQHTHTHTRQSGRPSNAKITVVVVVVNPVWYGSCWQQQQQQKRWDTLAERCNRCDQITLRLSSQKWVCDAVFVPVTNWLTYWLRVTLFVNIGSKARVKPLKCFHLTQTNFTLIFAARAASSATLPASRRVVLSSCCYCCYRVHRLHAPTVENDNNNSMSARNNGHSSVRSSRERIL